MNHHVIGQTGHFHSQITFILHLTAHGTQNTHYPSMPLLDNIRGGGTGRGLNIQN